ncbi:MAG: cell division protein ZapA [Bauldia sp.]|nr:cell division protein ZapA [Bauldia sp.]
MSAVNVMINGKSYRMACDDGQESHLLDLAEELNGTIDRLRGDFGEIGDQRLIVMASITMADSLSEMRRQLRQLEADVAALRRSNAMAVERFDANEAGVARALEGAAERISAAARRLGEAG